jgi:hypothetical protein
VPVGEVHRAGQGQCHARHALPLPASACRLGSPCGVWLGLEGVGEVAGGDVLCKRRCGMQVCSGCVCCGAEQHRHSLRAFVCWVVWAGSVGAMVSGAWCRIHRTCAVGRMAKRDGPATRGGVATAVVGSGRWVSAAPTCRSPTPRRGSSQRFHAHGMMAQGGDQGWP